MTMQDYINAYDAEIEDARQIYISKNGNDTNFVGDCNIETPNGVVGYYLVWYQNDALTVWLSNLKIAKQKHDTDEVVTAALQQLFLKP